MIAADPVISKRRLERMRERLKEPEVRKRQSEGVSAARLKRIAEDPDFAAAARRQGAWLSRNGGGNAAQPKGSEPRMRAGRKISAKRLKWCPPEYRAEYRRLRRKYASSKKARAEIERRLTPFERQLEAIRNGAGISAKPVLPSKSYSYTLGGVSEMAG